MPRRPRLVLPGQPLHVVQRGNNRNACFLSPDDHRTYARALRAALDRSGCAVHAYVLMNNHVHLLVTPADPTGPARLMQQVGRAYVRYFNERHARTGTLWEGRFHSTLIESDRYLLACCRYIEMNPVRAGIADHPGEYLWSSFRHNAGGVRDPLVTAHPLYLSLGGSATTRRGAYRGLFAGVEDPDVLQTIRAATRMKTILGSADFEEMVARRLERPVRVLSYGGDRKSAAFRRVHGSF